MIPLPEAPPPLPADGHPFVWGQDQTWSLLQERFETARQEGCEAIRPRTRDKLMRVERLLDEIAARPLQPGAQLLGWLENEFFDLSALLAACPDELLRYLSLQSQIRTVIKKQSRAWDLSTPLARAQLYRLLYGSRTAVEEVLLQDSEHGFPPLLQVAPEASATPSARILGLTIHSGDLLVSRGGAPTSALIARGNDFPGNFSHVALVHVDPETSVASIIEAHIERGVAVSSLKEYLTDRKLRVLVLRPRADLPALFADPMAPHQAAQFALDDASSRHIPYDFAMDFDSSAQLFCSEVASYAYRQVDIELWMGRSTISPPGLVRWLHAFGVTHFETQIPSDLEYDPQLSIVAEWRNPESLWQDHLDNAVLDAMLEQAEAGAELSYNPWLLPVGRVTRLFSLLLNRWGYIGPVPEGMSAPAALKNQAFSDRQQQARKRLDELAGTYRQRHGYVAPYWVLVDLARGVLKD